MKQSILCKSAFGVVIISSMLIGGSAQATDYLVSSGESCRVAQGTPTYIDLRWENRDPATQLTLFCEISRSDLLFLDPNNVIDFTFYVDSNIAGPVLVEVGPYNVTTGSVTTTLASGLLPPSSAGFSPVTLPNSAIYTTDEIIGFKVELPPAAGTDYAKFAGIRVTGL